MCTQGSILGPLLFLMFINDLPLYTNNVFTDLYADETTLYLTGHSQYSIQENLQLAVQKLSVWCKHNGMLLNNNKKNCSFKSNENIHMKEVGPYHGFSY